MKHWMLDLLIIASIGVVMAAVWFFAPH